MKEEIIKKLEEIVKKLTREDIKIEITIPKDIKNGDYSTNIAMRLAKPLGKNPMSIAEEIASKFEIRNPKSEINGDTRYEILNAKYLERVEAVKPGFVNFYLSEEALLKTAEEVLLHPEKAGTTESLKGEKIIVEFTDPNPFKVFHIGHVYTNTIGEALSRMHEALGATVHRADYFGDVGMHVAKALWGLKAMLTKDNMTFSDMAEKSLEERIVYFGVAYAKGSSAYEESEKAQEEMKRLNKLIYLAAQKMWEEEKGFAPQVDYQKGEPIDEQEFSWVYDWYVQGRKWSLEYFETIYNRLGMTFAGYYPESIAGEKGYKLVKDHIQDGTFIEDNGAIIFPGKGHGLHTRVFINSLGLPTYEAKELGLAVWKSEEFPYDFSIILTGNEINEYFKVLMKALSIIRPDLAVKSLHIGHGMVKLSSGKKMSSRTGQIISGEEVLHEAASLAKQKIAEAKIGRETVEGVSSEAIAEQVGIGAIKYSFLKSSIGKDVPFSFEESVSFEGNSGPYVQYTYTRTQSVLSKAHESDVIANRVKQSSKDEIATSQAPLDDVFQFPQGYLLKEEELGILRVVYQFREVVEESARTYSPNTITEYLFNLAQIFNNFYQKYRILNASGEQERDFRIALTTVVGIVLRQGLNLLGIQAPEKM